MPETIKQLSNTALSVLHRIILDRYRERMGCKDTNYDRLVAVQKETQRRVDLTINPYDNEERSN